MYYNDDELPEVVTFEEAREYMFTGRNTLLKILQSGELQAKKIGNKWRIKKSNLIDYVQNNK